MVGPLQFWLHALSRPPPDALWPLSRSNTKRCDIQPSGWTLSPMKPGYRRQGHKSIKSHEQTQQRPFREAELLLRPDLRLRTWIEKWQGTLLPLLVEVHPALQDLQERAQAQFSALRRPAFPSFTKKLEIRLVALSLMSKRGQTLSRAYGGETPQVSARIARRLDAGVYGTGPGGFWDVAIRRLVHTEYQRTRSVHFPFFGSCRLLRHCSFRPGLEKGP